MNSLNRMSEKELKELIDEIELFYRDNVSKKEVLIKLIKYK